MRAATRHAGGQAVTASLRRSPNIWYCHREASAHPLRRQARALRGNRATGVKAGRTGDQARPEIQTARHSAIAGEAIERITALYVIESEVRGKPRDQRRELRQSRSRPLIEGLHGWLEKALATLSRRRRQLRAVCPGRKSSSSHDPTTGERAAATYALTGAPSLAASIRSSICDRSWSASTTIPSDGVSELLPWNISLPTLTHSYKCPHTHGDSSVAYDSQSKIGQGEIDYLARQPSFIHLFT
jgi:Transposase IS66 family